ncbi:hypothetical protein CAEBREN_17722 [Caenorhabditis brenneri]|uniref:Uncharacterized protein n=1 Tax=Caenorhabditis brenneri TaxID=135651 RepID=G0MWK7_CAEBE|nr:hypothetical protein CAEBREN_17722 [Caenorhabditis brenneri]
MVFSVVTGFPAAGCLLISNIGIGGRFLKNLKRQESFPFELIAICSTCFVIANQSVVDNSHRVLLQLSGMIQCAFMANMFQLLHEEFQWEILAYFTRFCSMLFFQYAVARIFCTPTILVPKRPIRFHWKSLVSICAFFAATGYYMYPYCNCELLIRGQAINEYKRMPESQAFASLHISRGYGFKTLGLLNIIAFFVAPHYTMLVKRFIPGMTLGHRAALVSFIQFGLYAWSRHRQFYFEDLVVKLFQRVGTNALKNDFFRLLKFIFEINEEYWQELIKRTILEQPLHRRSSQDTPNGSLSLGDSVEVVTPNAKGQDVINYGSLSNRLFRYVRDHGRPFMMNEENEVLNHFGKYALETCLKNRFLTKIGKGDRQELILGPQAPTEDPQQELMQRVARGEGASTYEEIKRQRAVDLVDYELGLDGRFKQTDKTQPPVTFSLEVRR